MSGSHQPLPTLSGKWPQSRDRERLVPKAGTGGSWVRPPPACIANTALVPLTPGVSKLTGVQGERRAAARPQRPRGARASSRAAGEAGGASVQTWLR